MVANSQKLTRDTISKGNNSFLLIFSKYDIKNILPCDKVNNNLTIYQICITGMSNSIINSK